MTTNGMTLRGLVSGSTFMMPSIWTAIQYVYVESGSLTLVYGDHIYQEYEYNSTDDIYDLVRDRHAVPDQSLGLHWTESASNPMVAGDIQYLQKPVSALRFDSVGTNTVLFIGQYGE